MKHFKFAALLTLSLVFASFTTFAQESETKVVDEVVAQVNDGVITLSRIKRETRGVVDTYVQEGKKREDAQKMVDEKQGELIANLINEELLVQKAKELGLESDIDAQLNQRFVGIMKQYNLKTLDALYEEMQKQGVDPQEIREVWRQQATRDAVLQREVQSKVYWEATPAQVKDYYEKNKSKFTKPETVTLSEIFLSFAGRDEATVRDKAKYIIAQYKVGIDFTKLAVENSEAQNVAQTKGSVGSFKITDLSDSIGKAIANLKQGGISEPVEDEVGIHIIHVDERSAASAESQFDESAVRMAILNEKGNDAQKKYLSKLRGEAYIKINDTYRPMVSPILFADERTVAPAKPKAN
jgi:parvulin-like peptidyl-prolyl isomerase